MNNVNLLRRVTCTSFRKILVLLLLGLIGTQVYSYIGYGRFPSHPISIIKSPPNITLPQTILGAEDVVSNFFVKVIFATFRPDGKTLISVGSNDDVILWDVATGQKIFRVEGKKVFAFSSDSKTLATAMQDSKIIKLWNLETERQTHNLIGHLGIVDSLTFSPDNKTITSVSHHGGNNKSLYEIKLWNLKTEREIRTLKNEQYVRDNFHAISPNGQIVASVRYTEDGNYFKRVSETEVQLGNLLTGKQIRILKLNSPVKSVIFNSNGQIIATISSPNKYNSNEKNTITVWDLATGEKIRTIQPSFPINLPSLSPDGKNFIIRHEQAVILWHLATGKETRIPGGSFIKDSSSNLRSFLGEYDFRGLSPDGKTLASISNNTIQLWDLATGKEILILQENSANTSTVAFSPDSKILATGDDETIRLWDVATGKTVRTIKQDSVGIFCLAFSPDGKTLVSGGSKGTIRFWKVPK